MKFIRSVIITRERYFIFNALKLSQHCGYSYDIISRELHKHKKNKGRKQSSSRIRAITSLICDATRFCELTQRRLSSGHRVVSRERRINSPVRVMSISYRTPPDDLLAADRKRSTVTEQSTVYTLCMCT